MLRSLKDLERYKVSATDGELGRVVNVLLDDERWAVRYLVVDTGGFLEDRQVLISPISFRQIEWSTQRFHLALTMDEIRRSPSIDVDQPVTRQHETSLHQHYGYPPYWGYSGAWGMATYPYELAGRPRSEVMLAPANGPPGDVHLRSFQRSARVPHSGHRRPHRPRRRLHHRRRNVAGPLPDRRHRELVGRQEGADRADSGLDTSAGTTGRCTWTCREAPSRRAPSGTRPTP